jgi:hypothetical protein
MCGVTLELLQVLGHHWLQALQGRRHQMILQETHKHKQCTASIPAYFPCCKALEVPPQWSLKKSNRHSRRQGDACHHLLSLQDTKQHAIDCVILSMQS